MPTLGKEKLSLADSRKKKAESGGEPAPASAKKPPTAASKPAPKPRPPASLMDEDDDDDRLSGSVGDEDDGDEVIQASVASKAKGNQFSIKQLAIGGGVIFVVILVFIIFLANRGGNEPPAEPVTDPNQTPVTTPITTPEPDPGPVEIPADDSLGLQDFTQDTNNVSDSPLTDPNDFTKDIHDLTVRVNYEVKSIQTIADMVSYTKHRGTWDGGLELYWLDVTYLEKKYVIQVPFEYYKELNDTGIVPVKMEALRIESETDGEYLTVISYMTLDEATLKQIQRTQSRK